MLQEDRVNRLKELKQLLDDGTLTQQEFDSEKEKVLKADVNDPMSYFKQNKLRVFQVLSLIASILILCIDDDDICCVLSVLFALVSIVLSWIKTGRTSKVYATVSTIISVIVALVAVFELLGF